MILTIFASFYGSRHLGRHFEKLKSRSKMPAEHHSDHDATLLPIICFGSIFARKPPLRLLDYDIYFRGSNFAKHIKGNHIIHLWTFTVVNMICCEPKKLISTEALVLRFISYLIYHRKNISFNHKHLSSNCKN